MKEKLFVDTNAFVYYLTNDKDRITKVQDLLESGEYEIFTNILAVNEIIYKLLWISASEKLKTNKKFVLLNFIKTDAELRNEVYSKFIDFYMYLKTRCKILDLKEDEIMMSCQISNNYGLLPTDASIVATMIKNNIKKILTDDSDFKKIKSIEVIEV